jgi:hypothetical protein
MTSDRQFEESYGAESYVGGDSLPRTVQYPEQAGTISKSDEHGGAAPSKSLAKFRLILILFVAILGGASLYGRLFAGKIKQRFISPGGKVVAEYRIYDFAAATDADESSVQLRTKFKPFRHTVFSELWCRG